MGCVALGDKEGGVNERWRNAIRQSRKISKTRTADGKRRSVRRWAELTLEALHAHGY